MGDVVICRHYGVKQVSRSWGVLYWILGGFWVGCWFTLRGMFQSDCGGNWVIGS